jgi:hypothetical protein
MSQNGIFTERQFEFNPKCVLFATAMMGLYWFLPQERNKLMLPFIFVVSYVSMAWYDKAYECKERLKSGSAPLGAATFDSIFKPQLRSPSSKTSEQERIYRRNVYTFHVLAVVPLLLYVGYYGKESNRAVFPLIGALGVLALAYHAYRMYDPRKGC